MSNVENLAVETEVKVRGRKKIETNPAALGDLLLNLKEGGRVTHFMKHRLEGMGLITLSVEKVEGAGRGRPRHLISFTADANKLINSARMRRLNAAKRAAKVGNTEEAVAA